MKVKQTITIVLPKIYFKFYFIANQSMRSLKLIRQNHTTQCNSLMSNVTQGLTLGPLFFKSSRYTLPMSLTDAHGRFQSLPITPCFVYNWLKKHKHDMLMRLGRFYLSILCFPNRQIHRF